MSKKLIVVSAIVALVVGVVIGAMFAPSNNLGGLVRLTQDQFVAGLKAGSTGQFVISSTGAVTSSADVTADDLILSGNCIEVTNSTGSTTAITFVGSGATTTTVTATLGSCN